MGPQTALELIRKHHTIENILEVLQAKGEIGYSSDGFDFVEARKLFVFPEVTPAETFHPDEFLCYTPNLSAVKEYLVEKSFNSTKVDKMLERCNIASNKIFSMYR